MPSYKISFPDIEVNAIHGKEAMEKAIEELKRKDNPHGFDLYANDIKWIETHTDECDCLSCVEERN